MHIIIDTNQDHSENIHYSFSDYFAYVSRGILSSYPNYTADIHWHDDIEFIAILSGSMQYNIDGAVVSLHEGEGIFVNSRHLHYGFSSTQTDCDFICILFHPLMLCTTPQIEQLYVTPLLKNRSFSYRILHDSIPWENRILSILKDLFFHPDEVAPQLQLQCSFFETWKLLFSHMPADHTSNNNHNLSTVKCMLRFIQEHYREKISLEDIANAGNICKSQCCALFHKYLRQTPVNYLILYRLEKSTELLTLSDMTITEICFECGFFGASYYTETFRRHFNCSPREYRKKQQESTLPAVNEI